MIQWLGINLPRQRTWVQSLVREESLCHGTTKTHMPQILSLQLPTCSRACELQPLSPHTLKPALHSERSHCIRSQCTTTREKHPVAANRESLCAAPKTVLLLLSRFSRVQLCATPWTAAYQAPPSMGFSRQEYWSGVPLNKNTEQPKTK